MRKFLLGAVAAMGLVGCFTVSQSDYPQVEMTSASETTPPVALSGFEATVLTFMPIYGYSTFWESAPATYRHGRYYHGYDYPTTVSTTTYIPQEQLTPAYFLRAQDALENAGFIVSPTNATRQVNVRFSGPVVTDGDRTATFASMLFSALTAEYSSERWSAQLKITDVATGRVVFNREYVQDYSACAWGPIPLFSPIASETVSSSYIQDWCLKALTDRTMADASAFLAETKAEK